MLQHQKAFVTDPATGIVSLKFQFPQGTPQENVERVVNPAGPRPGHEVRVRWEIEQDGSLSLVIGEVSVAESPKAVDDLDAKGIKELLTLGVREGLNGKNGTVALTAQMHPEELRAHIRENRKRKAAKTELATA